MKKLVSLLLALMMAFGCTVALAADSEIFQPQLVGSVDKPGSYWNESDVMRSKFVASMLVDLILAGYEEYADVLIDGGIAEEAAYFNYDPVEQIITVFVFSEAHTMTIIYMPAAKAAAVGYADSTVPPYLAAECISYIEDSDNTVYYHIDGAMLTRHIDELVEVLTGE